jgi:predicted acyl esterase
LKDSGITTGTNPAGTLYSQANNVTRGQMAAFLVRLASFGDAWDGGVLARGSVGQISAEGIAGTVVSVYDDGGDLLDTVELDVDGGKLWRDVPPGVYRVVYADSNGVSRAVEVVVTELVEPLADMDHPSGPLYTGQTLRRGFNYLTMRDGTQLATFVTYPAGPGPYPTLVEYSGYDLSNPYDATSGSSPYRLLAPQFGYALVQVQMRGTACSAGAFDYFEQLQSLDGYDAIETVAAQSWVKGGKVGTVGISYPGISQLFVAQTQPPSLAAITPVSAVSDMARGVLFPGGIYNNGFARNWAEGAVGRAIPSRPQQDGSWRGGLDYTGVKITGVNRQGVRVGDPDLQCAKAQRLHGQAADLLTRIDNSQYETPEDEYLSPQRFASNIVTPTLIVGAWQDEQTGGGWTNVVSQFPETTYVKTIAQNGTHIEPIAPDNLKATFEHLAFFVKGERPNINVVVLNILLGAAIGQLLGGATIPAGGELVFTASEYDNTSRYPTYTSARNAFLASPRVLVRFDNGAGPTGAAGGSLIPSETKAFTRWPLPAEEVTTVDYFFTGDGGLSTSAPAVVDGPGSSISYQYDPTQGLTTTWTRGPGCSDWAPTPTDNNGQSCFNWTQPAGQNYAAFVSEPLATSTFMVGNALADLWLTWDPDNAPEENVTDVEVTISEVTPDGNEVYVQSGWARSSFCVDDPELSFPQAPWATGTLADAESCQLQPGVATQVRVPVFPFAHIFRAGSQIRVSVDAPGATRVLWTFDSAPDPATITLDTNSTRSSKIILPVVTNQINDQASPTGQAPNPATRWVRGAVTAPVLADRPACGILRAQPCRIHVPQT